MASKRIQGITIEIGGDTTKLTSALKDVDKSLGSTQNALKDINRLLKMDPGNTELLSQKQRLLAEAIKETKDRLEQLKEASRQANEQLEKGEISQKQYDALQREIAATEASLKKLEEQASKSHVALEKMAQVGDKLKNLGNNITNVGKKFMPITGAVTAAGAGILKTSADFEAAMSEVAAISGASGDDLDKLTAKARELGKGTKFSASEVASGFKYMSMAGWSTAQMLDGIEGVLNLSAASGEDLASTSDIVTDALTAFGLKASDSGHFADVLAAASSNANTNVSMMGETFKYVAPIAGALGFSAEDTAVAIGLMANAGIKSSQAGTSLRTIMNAMAGEIKISSKNMGEMVVQTSNADGSMRSLDDILMDCRKAFSGLSESEKASNAEAIFGKNAMSGFLAIMNAGDEDVSKLTGAIEGCNGQSKEMADIMNDNLSGQLTILKSQLEELALSFGEILLPIIREVVTHIQGFIDKLNSMDEGTRRTIITIAAFAAAIGPVLIIVGQVITAVGTIITFLANVGMALSSVAGLAQGAGAAAAAAGTAALGPAALVVAAIAGIVAIFTVLWNNCEGFREFWINLWEAIKEACSNAWTFITEILTNAWSGIAEACTIAWEGISEFFVNLWESIKAVFSEAIEAIATVMKEGWEKVKDIINTTLSAISDVCKNIWNAIKDTVISVMTAIRDFVVKAWEAIKEGVTRSLEAIKETASRIWTAIKELITEVLTDIKETAIAIWEAIKEACETCLNAIKETAVRLWNEIKDAIQTALELIKDTAVRIWTEIKEKTAECLEAIKETAIRLWTEIKEAIREALEFIKETAIRIWNEIKEKCRECLEAVKQVCIQCWEAIKSATSTCLNAIKQTAIDIWNQIRDAITNCINQIRDRCVACWESLNGAVSAVVTRVKDTVLGIFEHLKESISNVLGNIVEAIRTGFDKVADFMKELPQKALTWGSDFIGGFIKGVTQKMQDLMNTVRNMASQIASYIHFSEPDVGPLSNFHTFMPDMIDLMRKGITDNMHKLDSPMKELSGMLVPSYGNNPMLSVNESTTREADNSQIIALLSRYLPQMANTKVVLDTGTLVGEMASGMNRQLGRAYV